MEKLLDKKLYTILKKCLEAKFWNVYSDSQIIALQLPREKEPIFISVVGKDVGAQGFIIYRGYQELAYLFQAVKDLEEKQGENNAFQHDCRAIYFDDKEKMRPQDLQRIEASEISFENQNSWPILIDFKDGYSPSYIEIKEQAWLIPTLERFYETAIDFQKNNFASFQDELVANFKAFAGRCYDLDGNYCKQLFTIPEAFKKGLTSACLPKHPLYLSQFEIIRASQTPLKPTIWEVDFHRLKTQVNGDHNNLSPRPYYPNLFLVADQGTQDILVIDLIKADDVEEYQRKLLRLFLYRNYRPSAVCIKRKKEAVYAQSYLEELFKQLDISLHYSETLPILDLLRPELEDFPILNPK